MKRRIHLSYLLAIPLLLGGCMGYQLGAGGPEGIERVYVAPVINRTREPAIELQVTHALRERLQLDGRFELVNKPEQADGTIEVRLTEYKLSPIAYRKDLKTAAKQYRLRIAGEAELKSRTTEAVISTSKTYGEAVFEFESDLTNSKRIALPKAARELAKFTVDDLIEQW